MEAWMNRMRRLVAAVVVLATAGLTTAQSPTMTSPTPTQPASPSSTPGVTPAPMAPTPGPTLADTVQTMPAGRSTWKSQDGSVVDLTVDSSTGAVTGTFTPGFPCGLATSLTTDARPLVGTTSGNAVAWTLSLSACPSVGTWVGHFQAVGTEEQLSMLFTLAVAESPPGVGSTLTGSSLFTRQMPAATQ